MITPAAAARLLQHRARGGILPLGQLAIDQLLTEQIRLAPGARPPLVTLQATR